MIQETMIQESSTETWSVISTTKYILTGDFKHTQIKSDAFTVFKDVQYFECKRDLEDLSLIQNVVDKPGTHWPTCFPTNDGKASSWT